QMLTSSNEVPNHPGIVARADYLVSCERPELSGLPFRLLGTTLIVQDLATARTISTSAKAFRFVTLEGNVLGPDGTLTVGKYQDGGGLLSRKGELHELRLDSHALEERIHLSRSSANTLQDHAAALENDIDGRANQIEALTERLAELRTRIGQRQQQEQSLRE